MGSSDDQQERTSSESERSWRARHAWTGYLVVLTLITLVPIGISFVDGGYKKPNAIAEAVIFTVSIGLIAAISVVWVHVEKRRRL